MASRASAIVVDAASVISVLLHEDGRGDQRPEPLDPEVVGWTQNHRSVSAFSHGYLRLQDSFGT